ncbi:transposase [Chloroflexi bacterium TSY]|nr:transposase [Chloroflexi bacterium TSY]
MLNRAKWDGLMLSYILLHLIVDTFVVMGAPVEITVDETLERRWGPKISKRGHWRDSLASGRKMNVSTSGLRWLVFCVVVKLPWSDLYWSLPFLSVLLTTPKVSETLNKRHRTVAKRTMQVVAWLRRALPGREIKLIGDGAYSVIELGLRCQSQGVTLIGPLRLDARLFDYPPSRLKPDGTKRPGRPPVVGQRLPKLADVALFQTTCWHRCRIDWYGGDSEVVDWATGLAFLVLHWHYPAPSALGFSPRSQRPS